MGRRTCRDSWGSQRLGGAVEAPPTVLTTQELLDARGDAGGVQAVLGVEALRIAGLAEALHTDSFEWRRHHVAQHLGHRAAETAVERVVLDRHDVAGLARRTEEQLLVEGLDARRVDD